MKIVQSPSNRSRCEYCKQIIIKGDLRVENIDKVFRMGNRMVAKENKYHFDCFQSYITDLRIKANHVVELT